MQSGEIKENDPEDKLPPPSHQTQPQCRSRLWGRRTPAPWQSPGGLPSDSHAQSYLRKRPWSRTLGRFGVHLPFFGFFVRHLSCLDTLDLMTVTMAVLGDPSTRPQGHRTDSLVPLGPG
jgi:hypothetical protein